MIRGLTTLQVAAPRALRDGRARTTRDLAAAGVRRPTLKGLARVGLVARESYAMAWRIAPAGIDALAARESAGEPGAR